ncbi:carboxypeptidase-like regulatory domain-containing protein [Arthrobacter psychrolactophilus]
MSGAPGVDVSKAYVTGMPDNGFLATRSAKVNADGTYILEDLAPANYTVKFKGYTSGGYDAWYGGVTQATAKPVTVGAGQAISGINVNVSLGATVSGTVSMPAGISNGRVAVQAWPDDPSHTDGTILYSFSDIAGRYILKGLPPGAYNLCFSPADDGALTGLCGPGSSEGGLRISVLPSRSYHRGGLHLAEILNH